MQRALDSKNLKLAAFLLSVVLTLLSETVSGFAQGVPNGYGIGSPENALFSGSDFESVQIGNNNLHIEVPLWSMAGRGLPVGYKYVYDSKGWGFRETCGRLTGTCTDTVSPNPRSHTATGCCSTNNLQMPLVSLQDVAATSINSTANCNAGPVPVYGFTMKAPEGTKHSFVPNPVVPNTYCPTLWTYATTVYASDGSGWMLHVDPNTGAVLSIVRKDGAQGAGKDTNGNQMGSGTDTLGRAFSATSYYDSNGVLRNITTTWQSVAIQTHLCWSSSADFCNEYSATWNMPQVITLPN